MPGSKPTIKQKLAAIRMLYDFLVIRQLVPVNPTASVRGPKYVVKRGKTPVWSREDAKKLLESIPRGGDLAGLRDRAVICTMLFSFARISAVLSLKRQDFYYQGPRRWLRFHEKGGKEHEMPAHHQIEETIDEYLSKVGIDDKQPLFQSVNKAGSALSGRALNRHNAWAAIRKRARNAGFLTPSPLRPGRPIPASAIGTTRKERYTRRPKKSSICWSTS